MKRTVEKSVKKDEKRNILADDGNDTKNKFQVPFEGLSASEQSDRSKK